MGLLIYGWFGIAAYWGSPRMMLDLLWVIPAMSVEGFLILRAFGRERRLLGGPRHHD